MSSKSKVILIPWDYDSAAHRAVLSKQREECTWHQEKVEKEWRELQAKGDKCIYWIVSHMSFGSSTRCHTEILMYGTRLLTMNKVPFSDDSHTTEEMKLYLRSKESQLCTKFSGRDINSQITDK